MTEFRPQRFQILPVVIKNLLIINVLVFIAQSTFDTPAHSPISDLFALHTWQSPLFKPWQFITHMFMHGGINHIFFNMFALWMFGSILENIWGPKRFLVFYMVSGLGAALCHMLVLYFQNQTMIHDYSLINNSLNDAIYFVKKYGSGASPTEVFYYHLNMPTVGASGAIFGCLAAFAYLFPNTYIYLYFFIPIKAKWFVLIYAAFELYATIQSSAGDNVAHVAHLGGALFGFLMVYTWNKKNRRRFY